MNKTFYYGFENNNKNVSNKYYQLHSHDEYEIYMFFEGDSKYVVEENSYSLKQGDVVIIRKHELHRVYHNNPHAYHRLVLMVSPEFFIENNCPEYETAFLENSKDKGNKIDAKIVRSSGLFDAIMRFKKYSDEFKSPESPIAKSTMVEILYIINSISSFSDGDEQRSVIKDIISFLNENFTEDISLDDLSDRFFISKYYLCRAFKKTTGLTVQNYIKQKRQMMVKELYSQGMTLTQASAKAGFRDYSSFYRNYKKDNDKSPKDGI